MGKISILENNNTKIKTRHLSPLKAIRKYCLTCGGRPSEVRKCQSNDCSLYVYRMGRNPNRRDIGVGIRAENGRFQAKITSPAAVFKKNKENKDIDKDLSLSNNRGAVSKESGWPGISINKRGEIEIKETQEGLLIKITNSSNKKEKLNVSSNKRKASAIGVTTPTKESTNPGTEAKTNSEKGT